MLGLDHRNHAECRGDLREALLVGHLRELAVEHIPLLILTARRSQQILLRRADLSGRVAGRDGHFAALEELEKTLGVLLLLLGRLQKDTCDLLVALFLGLAGKKHITAPCLALAGEGLQQILLGTRTFDALFHKS